MSRVGKVPVTIPSSLKVSVKDSTVTIASSKAQKSYTLSLGVAASLEGDKIKLTAIDKSTPRISMYVGMDRSNISNIVAGLTNPFKIVLEVNGVGYKVAINKNFLVLTLGYSHEIMYFIPQGVAATFEKPNLIVLTGEDKSLVGQVAAEIISFRKPEPYKGKGIKVQGKAILRKEGKKK